jgi:hypothetical protein
MEKGWKDEQKNFEKDYEKNHKKEVDATIRDLNKTRDTIQNNDPKCQLCAFLRGIFAASISASWAELLTLPLDTAKVRF